jgi:hypothetical protein
LTNPLVKTHKRSKNEAQSTTITLEGAFRLGAVAELRLSSEKLPVKAFFC